MLLSNHKLSVPANTYSNVDFGHIVNKGEQKYNRSNIQEIFKARSDKNLKKSLELENNNDIGARVQAMNTIINDIIQIENPRKDALQRSFNYN